MVATLFYEGTGTTDGALIDAAASAECRGVVFESGTSVIGKIVTEVKIQIKKTGTPTGDCHIAVVKNSDETQITIDTLDMATITTSFVEYTFTTTTNTYEMVADDWVAICAPGTDASNYLIIKQGTFPISNITCNVKYGSDGIWEDYGTGPYFMNAKMYAEGASTGTGGMDPPPPFNLVSL